MAEVWFSDIVALPSLFSGSMYEQMIYEKQCFALYTLAEYVAHYASHWWNNWFREEINSTSAARVGMELVKCLNKGLQLLQLCAGNDSTVVWTIVSGAGQFREVVEDVRRYAQMMNRLIANRSDFRKQEIVEELMHKVEFDCRVLQTSLGYAYGLDRITILERFKSRQSSSNKGTGLVLDDALLSCLISILEKKLPSDIAKSNLCGKKYLGHGTYGSVQKGKCCGLDVAVKKFLCKDSCQIELKIFKRFLETDYPFHVVGILGCSDRSIVLELMDKNLKELIEAGGVHCSPFSLDQSLDIMLQIAEGMKFMHAQDVIYRDLKPANVLIQVTKGQSLVVKLADFGVSKEHFDTELTSTTRQGTMLYMAPEMMEEGLTCKYTRKVDVHSFGMVCCEILTGKRTDLMPSRLKNGERPLLPQDIPTSLGSLIHRCWDQTEDKRPKFEEICDELWLIKERCLTECRTEDAALDDKAKLSFSMGGLRRLRVESVSPARTGDNSQRSDSDVPGNSSTLPSALNANKNRNSSSSFTQSDPDPREKLNQEFIEKFNQYRGQLSVDENNGDLPVAQSALVQALEQEENNSERCRFLCTVHLICIRHKFTIWRDRDWDFLGVVDGDGRFVQQ